jgi:hypothetical protein
MRVLDSIQRRRQRRYGLALLTALIAAPGVAAAQVSPNVTDSDFEAFRLQTDSSTRKAPSFDPIQVPSGGRPLTIARSGEIPRQLNAAILRAQCKLSDSLLARRPVLIFRPADGYRVMALVPCQAITLYSRAFAFERSVESEPVPMVFPVVALSGGISASQLPGLMSWDPQSKTLLASRGNNVCPARGIRHTYRQGGGELNGFALIRVEHRELRCSAPETDWQTLWQAPSWNLQP